MGAQLLNIPKTIQALKDSGQYKLASELEGNYAVAVYSFIMLFGRTAVATPEAAKKLVSSTKNLIAGLGKKTAGEATDAGVRVGDSFVPSGSSVVKGGTVQLSQNFVPMIKPEMIDRAVDIALDRA